VNFPQFLAEEMDGDEVCFMVAAALAGLIGLGLWYTRLAGSSQGFFFPRRRGAPLIFLLAITPLVCLFILYAVLIRWSDPQVRFDARYIFLFLAGGAAWLVGFCVLMPVFGMSLDIDVLSQRNPAVALVFSGGMLGVTFAYSMANIGEGPTIWTTIGPALLSTGTLLLLWFFLEQTSAVSEAITIDRDIASGLRLGAFLASAGLILGRAVVGNWESMDATVRDFLKYGWPALILAFLAAIVHRAAEPNPKMPRAPLLLYAFAPSFIYLAIAATWLVYMGKW
jgi:hypothetical protein